MNFFPSCKRFDWKSETFQTFNLQIVLSSEFSASRSHNQEPIVKCKIFIIDRQDHGAQRKEQTVDSQEQRVGQRLFEIM